MNRRVTLVSFLVSALLVFCLTAAQAAGARAVSAEDHELTQRVYSALNREFAGQPGDSVEVIVKTFQGEVTLTGAANEMESITKAGEIASRVSGVKSVTNRISIRVTY